MKTFPGHEESTSKSPLLLTGIIVAVVLIFVGRATLSGPTPASVKPAEAEAAVTVNASALYQTNSPAEKPFHRSNALAVGISSDPYLRVNQGQNVQTQVGQLQAEAGESQSLPAVKPPSPPTSDAEYAALSAKWDAEEKARELASRNHVKFGPVIAAKIPAPAKKIQTFANVAATDEYVPASSTLGTPVFGSSRYIPYYRSGFGALSKITGLPKTNYVQGYTKANGTHVNGYYRSSSR